MKRSIIVSCITSITFIVLYFLVSNVNNYNSIGFITQSSFYLNDTKQEVSKAIDVENEIVNGDMLPWSKKSCDLNVSGPYITNWHNYNDLKISYKVCNGGLLPFPSSITKIIAYEHSRYTLGGFGYWSPDGSITFPGNLKKGNRIVGLGDTLNPGECRVVAYNEDLDNMIHNYSYNDNAQKYQCEVIHSLVDFQVYAFESQIKIGVQSQNSELRDCYLGVCYVGARKKIEGYSQSNCGNGVIEFRDTTGVYVPYGDMHNQQVVFYINGFGNGEECDDGNQINGDGCSSTCQSEMCLPGDDCNNNTDCGASGTCNGLGTCQGSYINNPGGGPVSCSNLTNQQACESQPYQGDCTWQFTQPGQCSC